MAITNSQQAKQIIQKNKKIKGQDHMLAYITPNEAEKLMTLGGREVMTKEGIPAYPEFDNYTESSLKGTSSEGSGLTRSQFEGGAYQGTGSGGQNVVRKYDQPKVIVPEKKPKKTKYNTSGGNKFYGIAPAVMNYLGNKAKYSAFGQWNNTMQRKNYLENLKTEDPNEYESVMSDLEKINAVEKGVDLSTHTKFSDDDPMTMGTDTISYNDLWDDSVKEVLGEGYQEYLKGPPQPEGGDGPEDPCKGPNPPAYCFAGIRSAAPVEPVVEEESATPWRLMNKGGIVRTGFNMGGAQFTSGENISPGTSSTGGVRDDNPFTGGNGGGGGGSGDSGNVTPVVVTPKKIVVPEKSMKEKFFDFINFGDDEDGVTQETVETVLDPKHAENYEKLTTTTSSLVDADPELKAALGLAQGGRANFMGGGDTSLQAGAPELRLQGDVQPKENMMMASNDPMLEEEYEKYVFEMIEQGLEPMSFEQFRAQALSGMAEGGIAGLRQGYIIGGIVKAAKKAVKGVTKTLKKISKSKVGKAALIGAGLYGLNAAGGLGGLFGKGSFNPFLKIGAGGTSFSPFGAFANKLGLANISGGLTGLGKGALYGLGTVGLTKLLGQPDDEDEDEDYRGEGLDIAAIRRDPYLAMQRSGNPYRLMAKGGKAEPVAKEVMPLLDMGGMEKDYRANGGFVPIGRMEKADDVPARLSKNEFVFTAEAVRNAGEGDIDKGSEVMYNMMKNLEAGGDVSEESQGLDGAREMFQTSQKLEGVM